MSETHFVSRSGECWVGIPGFIGRYAISDRGHIISSKIRGGYHHWDKPLGVKPNQPQFRFLKLHINTKGYPSAALYFGVSPVKRRYVPVHKLVSELFLGPSPAGMQVNHKDGNKQNNCVTNLEYVTNRENIHHAHALGLISNLKGEKHPMAKLSEAQVREIRRNAGKSSRILAREYGISHSHIRAIISRKIWKHLT